MISDLCDLFMAFLRASNLGFGGGTAIIPLIQAEAVDKYHWMTMYQFTDTIAVTNVLPGPIATKIAAYIGYQVASWPGVIVALIAVILPTVLILIFLSSLMVRYAESDSLKAMLKGAKPVVTALLIVVTWDMAKEAFNIQHQIDYLTFVIAAAAVAGIYLFKIHPAVIIMISLGAGYFIF